MIHRFYVNNFRCLENFELPISGLSSALLIGKNGSGKTTVSFALEILQRIARGTNRVGELLKPKDFSRGRSDAPMRFELEVELQSKKYKYVLAFELPEGFKELRVSEEMLAVDGLPIYRREIEKVRRSRGGKAQDVTMTIDWHLVALPILQQKSTTDPLFLFKRWLARMLILRPLPSLIEGHSTRETLEPDTQVVEFGAWFTGLISYAPSAYSTINDYLKRLWPDLEDIKNPVLGPDFRSLILQFASEIGSIELAFKDLSDGEKCYLICSMVLASCATYGPLLCFWDEPDNHLALAEVSDFAMSLRRRFKISGGQFIATSHNPEMIRSFADDNILLLDRETHLDPTRVKAVSELDTAGGLIGTLLRGDLRI